MRNRRQLIALWVGILFGVLTCLYPVCNDGDKMPYEADFFASHRYLYTWPSRQDIDFGRTALQLVIVALLTFGAIVTLNPVPAPVTRPTDEGAEAG